MGSTLGIVKLNGILGHSQAKQFRQEVSDLIETGASNFLVDFEKVTFMDSSGLGALVSVLKTVNAAEGTLSLCAVPQEVKMLLELADVDQFFEIFPSQEAFQQAQGSLSSI